jgi:ribosomal protein L12E/L44/L45/RPP1/RPP2
MKYIASVCSISISANDEASVAVLEGLFNQFKPVIDEIPQVKEKISEGKVAYFYRAAGTKLFIDVVTKEGKIINPLLDMNIDFKEFQTFKASFKTDFVPSDFFNCSIEQIAEKFLKLVLCIEGETTNGKYLALSILKALEKVKLPNEKFQKKLQKAVTFLHFIVAFVQANFLLEFAPKEVSQNILTNALKEIFQTEDVNAQFEGMKVMAEQLGGQMIKPTLENMQMLDAAKAANIDEISLAWATPKYQGGIAHVVKLPGVTKMINEKFLA